jgi:RNA polymerase sigma factor (sigma-70 family)
VTLRLRPAGARSPGQKSVSAFDPTTGIAAGDRDAIGRVFQAKAGAMHAFACRLVGSRAVADDIVQEAAVAALRATGGWDSERSLASYLFAAVRSRAVTHLRHERVVARHAAQYSPGSELPVDEAVHRSALQAAVQRAIDALPARLRMTLLLSRYTELSQAEIAATLGISQATVESHIDRALRRLRVSLAPHWPLVVATIAVTLRTVARGSSAAA